MSSYILAVAITLFIGYAKEAWFDVSFNEQDFDYNMIGATIFPLILMIGS